MTGKFGTATASTASGALSGLAGLGGSTVVNLTVNVAGNVSAEKDLIQTIETQLQRGAFRAGSLDPIVKVAAGRIRR